LEISVSVFVSDKMKVATWNVNGIRARAVQFQEWLQIEQPDVVCLQETKASFDQIPLQICDIENYWCYWHGHRGYSGVALHFNKKSFPDKPSFSHPVFDTENRIVTASGNNLAIASVYVPNGGKDFEAKMQFLEEVRQYVLESHNQGLRLILCGDLNVARTDQDVHPKERRPGAIGQRPEERELLERILEAGLVDVGRTLDPDNDGLFTWWAPWRNMRARNIGWRLDYVLASKSIAQQVETCTVLSSTGTSDHAPVVAVFNCIDQKAK
jgi:exodeoxyribonuclease III